MRHQCILCSSNDTELIEVLDQNDLINLYWRDYKCDVSNIIKENIEFIFCKKCDFRFFQPGFIGDEKFYNALQKFEWYYQDEKYEYDFVKRLIKGEKSILEVGCGKAAFSKYLDKNVKYTGLDFSSEAKKMAEINGIRIENDSVYEFAKKKTKYDVVCSFQVLEHVSDPYEFIKSSLSCLRKKGLFIIAVPSESSFVRYANNSILNMPPHHVSRWTDKSLYFLPGLFPIDIVGIYHERVSDIHKEWFFNTLIESVLFRKKKMLNLSTGLLEKITKRLIKKLFLQRLKEEFMPNGHTVIAVYKKR